MKSETHMSNLNLPTMSYTNLDKVLTDSGKSRVKLAYATDAMRVGRGIAVLHHDNMIATLAPDAIQVDTCGWDSVTTANRLNRILVDSGLPYRVSIKQGDTILKTDSLAPIASLTTATFKDGVLV